MADHNAEPIPADETTLNVALLSKGSGSGYTYLMQAVDSVTAALVHWTVAGAPDFAGVDYPGPNSPTEIAITAVTDG